MSLETLCELIKEQPSTVRKLLRSRLRMRARVAARICERLAKLVDPSLGQKQKELFG
jgi:hypothetical protein